VAVVALPNIVPQGPGAAITWELRSNTARFPSLAGYTRTLERGGAHFAATLRYENLNESSAARMRAFLTAMRGQAQRCYLRDFGYTKRGSFPAPELLTNPYFASGTTGWSGSAGSALTAADGILRVTQTGNMTNPQARQSAIAVTQYAPYVARGLIVHGRGALPTSYRAGIADVTIAGESDNGIGMRYGVLVPSTTTIDFYVYHNIISGGTAGDFFEVGFASAARCALVENGLNSLLRSDEFDNASWTKTRSSISANSLAAPDGTVTADTLIEDTSTNTHFVTQAVTVSSAAADYCFGVAVKASGRNWIQLVLNETTGGGNLFGYFNSSNGAIGTLSAGSNWANVRAFAVPLGDNWWAFYLVGRKTNAATTINAQIYLASADNVNSYTGTSSGLFVWRATMAQSSVPTRLIQTTSAATSGTSQTGSALYLKGLPASTNGLLLADDLAEIITPSGSQFVRALNSLNSDAAGLGSFQFEPPLRESPADNAGVVIGTPLMRAMLDERTVRWTQRHAGFVDLEFTAVEDMTA
jgi:hypothetical protein